MFMNNSTQVKLDQELCKRLVSIGMPLQSWPQGTGIHYIDHFGRNQEQTKPYYDCFLEDALKWFRDVKHIHINPGQYLQMKGDDRSHRWGYAIVETVGDCNVLNDGNPDSQYNSYEDAAQAGIRWVLDHVTITMTVGELREALKDVDPNVYVMNLAGMGLTKVTQENNTVFFNFNGDGEKES